MQNIKAGSKWIGGNNVIVTVIEFEYRRYGSEVRYRRSDNGKVFKVYWRHFLNKFRPTDDEETKEPLTELESFNDKVDPNVTSSGKEMEHEIINLLKENGSPDYKVDLPWVALVLESNGVVYRYSWNGARKEENFLKIHTVKDGKEVKIFLDRWFVFEDTAKGVLDLLVRKIAEDRAIDASLDDVIKNVLGGENYSAKY